uniref:Uncharacterized protein n=1 Tax=Anguilla anguilla TaxID=7936 RepID=A0A0E9XB81_ANGAN
MTLSIKLCV